MPRIKDKQINIRLTQIDYERIKRRATKANLSFSVYMLTMALQGEIVIMKGFVDIAKELRAIGNNLNQVTRLAHKNRIDVIDFSEMKWEVRKLWQLLNSQIPKETLKR